MALSGPVRRVFAAWAGVPDEPAVKRWVLVVVTDAIGTGMYLPISVLYFTVVVGLRPASVGLGLGIAGLLGSIASPVAGALVDRWGARAVLVACWLAAAVAFVGYLGVRGWTSFVLVATVAQVADHVAQPAKKVFLSAIVSAERRVPLMAFQRATFNVGIGLGGLVTAALLLVGTNTAYHAVLIADAVTFLGAAGLIRTIPVPRPGRPGTKPSAASTPVAAVRHQAGYRQVLRDRRYVALAVLNVLVLTYSTAFQVGMPLWVHQYTSAPTSVIPVLFTLNTVLVVLLQVRLTRSCTTVRQTPRAYLRVAGTFGLAALGYWTAYRLGRAEALVVAVLVAAVLAHTLAELYGQVGEWTVSFTLAPDRLRGRYLALFGLSLSAEAAIGPGLVTMLIAVSPDLAWFGLAGVLALGCLVTSWVVRGAAEPDEASRPADTGPSAAATPSSPPHQATEPKGHVA
jgi:MFS family permease